MKIICAFLLVMVCGCAPAGHVTGTYDPTTGDIVAGVDIEFKKVRILNERGIFEDVWVRVKK